MTVRNGLIVLAHAFAGWLLCFAAMGIGMATMPLETALIVHAAAAPILFAIVSWAYFTKFRLTKPVTTAAIFVGFVILADFFVVGLLINRSLAMFTSIVGTWLPFTLIFLSTWITGWVIDRRAEHGG
jgi:hypothetical protein